jgi:hypothetical protein
VDGNDMVALGSKAVLNYEGVLKRLAREQELA